MNKGQETVETDDEATLIKVGKKIGQGSYGRLHEYVGEDSQVLAVKIMKKTNQGIDTPLEMSIMKYCTNPYVNSAIEIGMDANHIYIFQELAECDLASYLARQAPSDPKEWYKQLLIATAYLHSEGIVHCDIKPANVLVMKDETVRVTDYSHSLLLTKKNNSFTHKVGSQRYCAPEVLLGKAWKKEIDIWSLGAVFYEIAAKKKFMAALSGKMPDDYFVTQVKKRPFLKEQFEDKELICSYMLLLRPEERYSAKDILSFYFDYEIEFEKKASPHLRVHYEKDRVQLRRIIGRNTSDQDVLKLSIRIHESTPSLPFSLVKAEACFVIACKMLKGYAKFDRLSSIFTEILAMEEKICEVLAFLLHK